MNVWEAAMKLALAVTLGAAFFVQAGGSLQESAHRGDHATAIDGEWYVASDDGNLIRVATKDHCSELHGTADNQTLFCRVDSHNPNGAFAPSLELDVYRRNGVTIAFKPGGEIGEWRIQKDGAQVAIDVYIQQKLARHELYDATTGHLVARIDQVADKSTLPPWAKSRSQIAIESVPESEDLTTARREWIVKVMLQIAELQPGMTRKDVLRVMTTEGGLSTRTQRTYVYPGCGYIKIVVRFTPVGAADESDESLDDTIVSVSQPYLAGITVD
jgi:hypothetical protein